MGNRSPDSYEPEISADGRHAFVGGSGTIDIVDLVTMKRHTIVRDIECKVPLKVCRRPDRALTDGVPVACNPGAVSRTLPAW